MTLTMKCSTAGLKRGQTVKIFLDNNPFLVVQDETGGEHLVLTGDVTDNKEQGE